MSSSDSNDSFYCNVGKTIRIAREQCLKNLENAQTSSTNNTGKSQESCSSEKNYVNTFKITENVAKNTPNLQFVDSDEDDLMLEEIIAKNTKPARGRGRKKKDAKSQPPKPPTPKVSNPRGRGRGKGVKRGRVAKNNIHERQRIINDALDAVELLNSTSQNGSESLDILNSLTRCRGARSPRKRRSHVAPNNSVEEVLDNLLNDSVNRRSRGRKRKGPAPIRPPVVSARSVFPTYNNMLPIYSVGNTDDYPDVSEDIPLFSKPTSSTNTNKPSNTTDEVVCLDDNETDNLDDELLSVKVIWKSLEVVKFEIRKYQKLTQIFDSFAQKENTDKDKLLFTYNNKILTCDDTPASIDYNIAKFIDGGVVSNSLKEIFRQKTKIGGLQIKFQCQNSKKPLEIMIGKDEKLEYAMNQCAEHLKVPLHKLKFEFDGDIVIGSDTPQKVGLENGDCVDIRIMNHK